MESERNGLRTNAEFQMEHDFSDEDLAALERDLRSAPVNRCKEVLDVLANCPSERAVPLFVGVARDGEFLRRRFAVMGLGNHKTEASFEALRSIALQEKDSNVLAETANSLFNFGHPSLPLLQEIFDRDPNWILRQSVIAIVMESDRDDILLDMVKKALQDEEQSVIETGILALGKLLKGEQVAIALELLLNLAEDEDWRIRWRAATALTLSDAPEAKDMLARLRQDDNHRVVAAALENNLS